MRSPFEIAQRADIGPYRTLLFWMDFTLAPSARPRVRFALNWLRETGHGQFAADLARLCPSAISACVQATIEATLLVAVALDRGGRLRLRMSRWRAASLRVEAGPGPDASSDLILRDIFAFDRTAPAPEAVRLAEAIYAQAFRALERQCTADLARCTARGEPLLDATFDFTPQGLAAYRAALADGPSASLARRLEGERTVEVHLPSFDRVRWPERWETLSRAEAAAEPDGRIFVSVPEARAATKNACQAGVALAAPHLHRRSGFEIGFTDTSTSTGAVLVHALPPVLRPYGFGPEVWEWLAAVPPGEVEASVSLSVPGRLAEAWLRGPAETAPEFFDVYSKVSVAIQTAMRRWVPYVYFSDLARFEDLWPAYALIFYRATYPCSGAPRSDFAYDLVSPADPGIARPWAARPLGSALGRAERLLQAAGRGDLARSYRSWRAPRFLAEIVARPRHLNAQLAADDFLVQRFVALGLAGRELAGCPDARRTARDLAQALAEFAPPVNRKLRRLYRGQDCTALGSLLLVEATRALAAALGEPAAISATLRFRTRGREQTFVNAPPAPAPPAGAVPRAA